MTPDNIEQREAALRHLVMDAGALALEGYRARQHGDFTLKGRQDFLTETDALVEQQVRRQIGEQFPNDGILGEETGGSVNAASLWVIDPIDGTANFARGIDHFCVAIAFVHQGKTELGAIYNPVTEECYLARRGQYARKNDQPMAVSNITDARSASVELGWSTRIPEQDYFAVYQALMASGSNIRRGASGALALAWVAEGRTDGYAELHMNAWDCLAGLLLVQEAGGRIGRFPNHHQDIANGGAIIAVNQGIADRFAQATGIELAPNPSTPLKVQPTKSTTP